MRIWLLEEVGYEDGDKEAGETENWKSDRRLEKWKGDGIEKSEVAKGEKSAWKRGTQRWEGRLHTRHLLGLPHRSTAHWGRLLLDLRRHATGAIITRSYRLAWLF